MQQGDPRSDILQVLRRQEACVDELSSQLGISSTAVRQHLAILERDGLVARTPVHKKVGRPKLFYSLSSEGEEYFPKAYYQVLTRIIADILAREGPEDVQALMGRLGAQHAAKFKERVGHDGNVHELMNVLNELGCCAELARENGHTILKEYNCLLYKVAMEFGDIICTFNAKFIETLLDTPVTMRDCIARGDRYCSFVIQTK
ncbi:MAG TPA: ArsR family transcriptional regulator [Methanomicrobia archaeon]|nr:ArsR family transcriptional regulator [Methanomicrobia archaeon]